jgi:hypothetical protein
MIQQVAGKSSLITSCSRHLTTQYAGTFYKDKSDTSFYMAHICVTCMKSRVTGLEIRARDGGAEVVA